MNDPPRRDECHTRRWTVGAALALTLGATVWAWSVAREQERSLEQLRFERQAARVTAEVDRHLRDCGAMLRAARGLFAASEDVTAAEWQAFISTIELGRHDPAVQTVAFIERVPDDQLDQYEASVRHEAPDFTIHPRDASLRERGDARVVRAIEPMEPNAAALGLDLRSHPAVLEAIDACTERDSTCITPPIRLDHEAADQPTVVMCLPVFDDRDDEKTRSVRGWLAAPIHLRVLLLEALRNGQARGLDLSIGEAGADPALTTSLGGEGVLGGASRRLGETSRINFAGREWMLRFRGEPEEPGPALRTSDLTLASGAALGVLLAGVLGSLARTGRVARAMAGEMTASLRESEARYQAAIMASRQVFYDWNSETDTFVVGGSVSEVLGIEAGTQLSLSDWIGIVHPDDRDSFRVEHERVRQTRARFELEYRLQRIDGSFVVVHDSGCFFEDAAGNVKRMVGFATDITDRRRAEEDRRQSDERFRVIFERSGVPFLLLSGGRVTDCNEAAVIMLGLSARSLLIGLEPYEFSPEFQPGGALSRAAAAGAFTLPDGVERAEFEWVCRRPTGAELTVHVVLTAVRVGGSRMVLAGWHDLTEVRRAEEDRRRLQRVLQIAVDAMPQRVFWKDKSGAFLGCNRAFARDAGFERVEDVIGKSDFDMVWRLLAHKYRTDDFAVMASGRPRMNFEETLTNAGGDERWLRTSKIPLCDETGRTLGIMGTFEDITDERASRAELRRARDAAESSSRAKSEFLANMSHEIRTPMAAILGYADLVGDEGVTPEQRGEYVRTIRRNGEHLLSIINDILDLSKIEAGKMNMERMPLSPVDLVREVISLMQPRAEGKGIRLEAAFDAPLPRTVTSDPTRLRQVLLNLVGNAIKFTEQGMVRVRLAHERADEAGFLRVDIIDSGIGMAPEVAESIFKPFSQADSSVTRRFGGTGLGLAISRRLVGLLGGALTVASQPGAGSTFTLRLPLTTTDEESLFDPTVGLETAPPAPPAHTPTRPQRLDGRVLLVEDGPDNQKLIAHILRAAGAEVVIAENGQVAIERLREMGPGFDLVLMDMQMPVLDGYSATNLARARGYAGPIVALTAHAMSGEKERCIAAGCDDYVTKPVPRARLIELCGRWIAEGRERASRSR